MELQVPGQIQYRAGNVMSLLSTVSLQPGLIHATRDPATTRVDVKVLIRLHESLNDVDFRAVRSWFVANLLGVDVSSVNRSLRHLEDLNYIERGNRGGNGNYEYRLSMPLAGAA